ncbi:MAG: ketol-acid reductoisomerase [Candidatus Nitrosocaldus sp.]|nr:ketol-acid reductoisomerase [Candidatus Nitrosocaldus sp.]MCS7141561.1 ketol-acid reductoisomerase [Candidatus Nitrosocaldus sp.]MDW8000319.1 ketol-acid reductoisomerase [Candidatus Nitrosocaldus sp.]MDW8275155.1 ketol-acid reductoisomerase [Candidatus Nitrosocaldus sp.]
MDMAKATGTTTATAPSSRVTRQWTDEQVSLDPIRRETVAVLGYGIQGNAQANNLRDSGIRVIVGVRKGRSYEQAVKDGHDVRSVSEAVKASDIIMVLIPDMEQARVYREEIEPYLKGGKALCFAHGAAIHWRWIVPPRDVDVFMVAPKAPGQRLRELYLENFGTPALVAVEQDATERAWERCLAVAKGIGCTRAGVIETTFKEEVETDWFGEQVNLCGGAHSLILAAFETLVEAGYRPEVAYFECLHELKLIVDLIQRYGITGMYERVSETARYGGLTRGPYVIDASVKARMRDVLKDIQQGKFAEEWVNAYTREGKDSFGKYMRALEGHEIERVGKRIRAMIWKE